VPLKSGLKVIENGTFGSVFDLSKNSGGPGRHSRIFCVGAQMEALTGESRRREDRGAEGAEGIGCGEGYPLPSRLRDLEERRELP